MILTRDRFCSEHIERSVATARVRAVDDGVDVLHGHVAVFDEWETLHDFFGSYKERIAHGAFTKTLVERRDQIKVLFNHGRDPRMGAGPIAVPESFDESDHGLHMVAPMLNSEPAREVAEMIRSGALTGQSFVFDALADSWVYTEDSDSGLDERTITEVRLYEAGPVVFPAFEKTDVGLRVDPALELSRDEMRQLAPLVRTDTHVAFRLSGRIAGPRPAAVSEPPSSTPSRTRNLNLYRGESR